MVLPLFDISTILPIFITTVLSSSMSPAIEVGQPITIDTTVPLDALQEGDIISFYAPDPTLLTNYETNGTTKVAHRIVDIEREDKGPNIGLIGEITTQGDANHGISIKDVDLTHDIDRDQLLELYYGKITIGDNLPHHTSSSILL